MFTASTGKFIILPRFCLLRDTFKNDVRMGRGRGEGGTQKADDSTDVTVTRGVAGSKIPEILGTSFKYGPLKSHSECFASRYRDLDAIFCIRIMISLLSSFN